jgi:hypothetical protein
MYYSQVFIHGKQRFEMHSSRSRVYGKTLTYFTRAVYPPSFLRTPPRWEASVFHVLWLGHMYMGSKGLHMHSSRSPVYGETLARCTCAVYPPSFLRTTPRWEASVFHMLWLGHMYMRNKGLLMHSSQSPVYGETLACCTCAVYPLAFFGQRQDGRLVCFMCFG